MAPHAARNQSPSSVQSCHSVLTILGTKENTSTLGIFKDCLLQIRPGVFGSLKNLGMDPSDSSTPRTSKSPPVAFGNVPYSGRPIVYVIKASKTSYINYMKVLMLCEELRLDYELSVVQTRDNWYGPVHPERYVPAIRDQDSATKEDIIVFESTACLQFLADKYDSNGTWSGKTQKERAEVMNWVAYQTAGIGATSKYWLYFSALHPEKLPKTVEKLHENCLKQWDLLEKRLSEPNQAFIALPDRPTIADLAYYPFAMPYMFDFLGADMHIWPHIKLWAQNMQKRECVQRVLNFAPTIGH